MSEPVTPVDDEFHDDPDDGLPADPVEEAKPDPLEPTGQARIDEALERLAQLPDLDITSHPAEFDAVHRILRESLAGAGRDEAE
jgi:hypothetical protein